MSLVPTVEDPRPEPVDRLTVFVGTRPNSSEQSTIVAKQKFASAKSTSVIAAVVDPAAVDERALPVCERVDHSRRGVRISIGFHSRCLKKLTGRSCTESWQIGVAEAQRVVELSLVPKDARTWNERVARGALRTPDICAKVFFRLLSRNRQAPLYDGREALHERSTPPLRKSRSVALPGARSTSICWSSGSLHFARGMALVLNIPLPYSVEYPVLTKAVTEDKWVWAETGPK